MTLLQRVSRLMEAGSSRHGKRLYLLLAQCGPLVFWSYLGSGIRDTATFVKKYTCLLTQPQHPQRPPNPRFAQSPQRRREPPRPTEHFLRIAYQDLGQPLSLTGLNDQNDAERRKLFRVDSTWACWVTVTSWIKVCKVMIVDVIWACRDLRLLLWFRSRRQRQT
ncbi:uncharacterized protein BDV17DRAFT_163697 [Aspergillus undulatus]|uniref:uncharacterized protein n=1 Tax=Aspergillus undulatus TaxID=1810928 RepID=UPI003CCDE320